MSDSLWKDADVVFSYTRAQAIEDGTLIDVSSTAREMGFKHSIAVTHAVWCEYVEVPDGVVGQDESGRLWDILWMLRCGIAMNADTDQMLFKLLVQNSNAKKTLVTLKGHCGPGDNAEPVITIMLPEED